MTKVGHWGNLGRRSAAAGIVIVLTFSWKRESEDLQESVMEGMHVRSSMSDKNTGKTAVTTILVVAAFLLPLPVSDMGAYKVMPTGYTLFYRQSNPALAYQ